MTKASLFALAVLGLPVAHAAALPMLYEPFGHPVTDGTNNSGLTGTDGEAYTAGGGYTAPNGRTWQPTGYGATATGNLLSPNYDKAHDVVLISPGLIVPGLNPGGAGNAASYGGPGYTARIDIRPTGTNAEDISPSSTFSNVVYYSLAFQVTEIAGLQAVGGPIAAFNNSVGQQAGNPTVLAGRTNIRSDGAGGYNIGLIKAQDGTAIFDTASYPLNTTQFIVVKYDFNNAAGSDDVATMWINPAPSTYGGLDPSTGTIITNANGTDVGSDVIRSFILRQGNTSTVANPAGVIADELRVGTTYADVTTIPEPSGVALAGLMAGVSLARRRRR